MLYLLPDYVKRGICTYEKRRNRAESAVWDHLQPLLDLMGGVYGISGTDLKTEGNGRRTDRISAFGPFPGGHWLFTGDRFFSGPAFFLFPHILLCFQLPDHTVNDRSRFFRCVINIRVHICQEILKNLKDKRFSDRKAHMLSGICLIGKGTRISTKSHSKIFRQMIQRFFQDPISTLLTALSDFMKDTDTLFHSQRMVKRGWDFFE